MKTVAGSIRSGVRRARPGTFFDISEFDGSRRAVESAFSRLVAEDDSLVRVRRGLYWKGVKSRFGPGRPRAEEVATKVAEGRGIGPAGWSASHALGLSTQVPAVPEFAVVGPPPTGVDGARFHSRRNFARLGLHYDEIALLEILRDWPSRTDSDWSDLERAVTKLVDEGRIRPSRILKVATSERAPAMRSHLIALFGDSEKRDLEAASSR